MPAQLPDDIWDKIIEELMQSTGLYAAKQLNRLAGLSTVFARAARAHPDNHVPHDVLCRSLSLSVQSDLSVANEWLPVGGWGEAPPRAVSV